MKNYFHSGLHSTDETSQVCLGTSYLSNLLEQELENHLLSCNFSRVMAATAAESALSKWWYFPNAAIAMSLAIPVRTNTSSVSTTTKSKSFRDDSFLDTLKISSLRYLREGIPSLDAAGSLLVVNLPSIESSNGMFAVNSRAWLRFELIIVLE